MNLSHNVPSVMYSKTEVGTLCSFDEITFTEKVLLSVRYQNRNEQLLSLTRCDGKSINAVFLTASAIKLLEIEVRDGVVGTKKYVPSQLPFDATQIINDLLLTKVSAEKIRTSLPPGWSMTEENNVRRVCDKEGQLVVEIENRAEQTRVTHYVFDYEIVAQKL